MSEVSKIYATKIVMRISPSIKQYRKLFGSINLNKSAMNCGRKKNKNNESAKPKNTPKTLKMLVFRGFFRKYILPPKPCKHWTFRLIVGFPRNAFREIYYIERQPHCSILGQSFVPKYFHSFSFCGTVTQFRN